MGHIGELNAGNGLAPCDIPMDGKISSPQVRATPRNQENGNNCAISIGETNHIQIHPKVSFIDGTYITLSFILNSTKEK